MNTKNNESKTVGILGGSGPLATAYFYKKITELTDAKCDQDHIDMLIISRVSTPDRTKAIINKNDQSLIDLTNKDMNNLIDSGVDIIAVPCNTIFSFFNSLDINKNIDCKILNIVEETVNYILKNYPKDKKVGILATTGTITKNLYQNLLEENNIKYEIPDPIYQQLLMEVIYSEVKNDGDYDINKFNQVIENLKEKDCSLFLLGCTELGVINDNEKLNENYVDSLEILAIKTIEAANKKVRNNKTTIKYKVGEYHEV